MTVTSEDFPGPPSLAIHLAKPDAYREHVVRCPLCHRRIDDAPRTPSIPTTVLQDDTLAVDLGDSVPVFGYDCGRHRSRLRIVAPATLAPDPYEPVAAVIDDRDVRLAVPEPVLAGGTP